MKPCIRLLILALLLAVPAGAELPRVRLNCQAPSHLFASEEDVAVTISLEGGRPDSLQYLAFSQQGAAGQTGKIPLPPKGASPGSIPLRLQLPRGLHSLEVIAREGDVVASDQISVGVVFEPGKPDPDSFWGTYTIPYDGPADEGKARALAVSHRMLGVAWCRLPFFLDAFEDLKISAEGPASIEVRFRKWKTMARALHAEGLSIMGNLCQLPRALSSRPNDRTHNSDAGPLFARVKPRSWELWVALVEKMAREFREEIQAWEIWNEPNIQGRYWAGTPDEFVELIRHTSAAIKRGNPQAKVVVSGFTCSTRPREHGPRFVEHLLKAGIGPLTDVFSSHNTTPVYGDLLRKHGLGELPQWNTECHSLLRLSDFKLGLQRSFHFIHRLPRASLAGHQPLTDHQMMPTPAGITYSVASHIIGNAKHVTSVENENAQVYVLRRGKEALAVYRTLKRGLLPGRATLALWPLDPPRWPEHVDAMGRVTRLTPENTRVTLPLEGIGFVRGAAEIRIVSCELPEEKPPSPQHEFPFTQAKFTGKWGTGEGRAVWVMEEPGQEGYAAVLPFKLPQSGRYKVYLHGTNTDRLEGPQRSISPFIWSMDRGRTRLVTSQLPAIWRVNTEKHERGETLNPPEMHYVGGRPLLQELGEMQLSEGEHTFRLELVERRRWPDAAWCLEVFALVLQPTSGESRDGELHLTKPDAAPGIAIPLANPGFEAEPNAKRSPPPGWHRVGRDTYVAEGYQERSGISSILFFNAAGKVQLLYQPVPSGKLAALLGRPLRVGDTLVLRAWARHYWEERGAPPETFSLGLSRSRAPDRLGEPVLCSLPGKSLTRDFRQFEARHRVTAEDLNKARPFWQMVLRAVSSQAPKNGTLWDDVTLTVEPVE